MIARVQPPRPSYEDLAALVELQAQRIGELEKLTRWQSNNSGSRTRGWVRAENAKFRRRLGMNSSSSSRPPSSDGQYAKRAPKQSGTWWGGYRYRCPQPGCQTTGLHPAHEPATTEPAVDRAWSAAHLYTVLIPTGNTP